MASLLDQATVQSLLDQFLSERLLPGVSGILSDWLLDEGHTDRSLQLRELCRPERLELLVQELRWLRQTDSRGLQMTDPRGRAWNVLSQDVRALLSDLLPNPLLAPGSFRRPVQEKCRGQLRPAVQVIIVDGKTL